MPNRCMLINESGVPVTVKEGSAGVWRNLKTLQNNDRYLFNVDPNATYREYWCEVKDPGFNQLYISTDDCQEYKSIIVTNKDGKYDLDKQPPKGTDVETQDGCWAKMKKFFGRDSTSTTYLGDH